MGHARMMGVVGEAMVGERWESCVREGVGREAETRQCVAALLACR